MRQNGYLNIELSRENWKENMDKRKEFFKKLGSFDKNHLDEESKIL